VTCEGVRCKPRRKTGICRVRIAESIMYWSIPQGHSAWSMQCRADRNLWRHLTLTVWRASAYECLPVPIRDAFKFWVIHHVESMCIELLAGLVQRQRPRAICGWAGQRKSGYRKMPLGVYGSGKIATVRASAKGRVCMLFALFRAIARRK
jgi:hypothetical protein